MLFRLSPEVEKNRRLIVSNRPLFLFDKQVIVLNRVLFLFDEQVIVRIGSRLSTAGR